VTVSQRHDTGSHRLCHTGCFLFSLLVILDLSFHILVLKVSQSFCLRFFLVHSMYHLRTICSTKMYQNMLVWACNDLLGCRLI